MQVLKWLWSPNHYWTIWFYGLFLALFAVREFSALGEGRPQDTFSWWVWSKLKIYSGEGFGSWSATDFLVFGAYCVIFVWLAYHFFWRKFT